MQESLQNRFLYIKANEQNPAKSQLWEAYQTLR